METSQFVTVVDSSDSLWLLFTYYKRLSNVQYIFLFTVGKLHGSYRQTTPPPLPLTPLVRWCSQVHHCRPMGAPVLWLLLARLSADPGTVLTTLPRWSATGQDSRPPPKEGPPTL